MRISLPELLDGCLALLVRFFPGVGHWMVRTPLTSGHVSRSQVVWNSLAGMVEAGTAARRAFESSVSMVCEVGKVMFFTCAWPTISRMGRKATPKPSPGFSRGKYSMRNSSPVLRRRIREV